MIKNDISFEYSKIVRETLEKEYPQFVITKFENIKETLGWVGNFFKFESERVKYFVKTLPNVMYDSQDLFLQRVNFSYSIYHEIYKRNPNDSSIQLPEIFLNEQGGVVSHFVVPEGVFEESNSDSEEEGEEEEEEEIHALLVFQFVEGSLIGNNLNDIHDEKIIKFLHFLHSNSKDIIHKISLTQNFRVLEGKKNSFLKTKLFYDEFDLNRILKWNEYYIKIITTSFDNNNSNIIQDCFSKFSKLMIGLNSQIINENIINRDEFVICHADLHGENLMVPKSDKSLIFVLDWDFIIIAPLETDLVFFKKRKNIMSEFLKEWTSKERKEEEKKNLFLEYFDRMVWFVDFIVALENLEKFIKSKNNHNVDYFKRTILRLVKEGKEIIDGKK